MKKGTILIWGGVIVLFLIVNFFANRMYKEEFLNFDSSSINGRLIEITLNKEAANISVGNRIYEFVPIYVNNETDFLHFAEKGDSIFKPAKADTLRLIHHGKTYLYTFKRF